MAIRTAYSRHYLAAIAGGYHPLTLRQFVALAASLTFATR